MSCCERPPSPVSPRTQARIEALQKDKESLEKAKMEYEDKMKKMDKYIQTVLNAKLPNGILIQEAINSNDMELFDLCVDHEKNFPSQYGELPLIDAAKLGRTEMVVKLLDRGVDINTGDINAVFAAISGNHLDTARLLIARGANLNEGKIDRIVDCLAKNKANLMQTLTMLLDAGFNVNRTETVHDSLQSIGHKLIARRECPLDIFKMMVERGLHFWSMHLRKYHYPRFQLIMENLFNACQSKGDVQYMLEKSREFNRLESFAEAFFAVMTKKLKESEHWATFDLVFEIFKQIPNDYYLLRHSFDFISSNAASTRVFLDDLAERLYVIDDTFFDDLAQRVILHDDYSIKQTFRHFIPLSDACMGFYKNGDVGAVTSFFKRLHERVVRFSAQHCEDLLRDLVLEGKLDLVRELKSYGFSLSEYCIRKWGQKLQMLGIDSDYSDPVYNAKLDIIAQAIRMFDPRDIMLHLSVSSCEMVDFFSFDYDSFVVAYPLKYALKRDQQLEETLLHFKKDFTSQ